MAEIKETVIDIEKLADHIAKLSTLKNDIEQYKVENPAVPPIEENSGGVVSELNEIVGRLTALQTSLAELVGVTIKYMEARKQSVEDKEAKLTSDIGQGAVNAAVAGATAASQKINSTEQTFASGAAAASKATATVR